MGAPASDRMSADYQRLLRIQALLGKSARTNPGQSPWAGRPPRRVVRCLPRPERKREIANRRDACASGIALGIASPGDNQLLDDALRVPLGPGRLRARLSIVLVEADKEPHQLAGHRAIIRHLRPRFPADRPE
jgi:hypothetical protein